jgi:hypothetical protein
MELHTFVFEEDFKSLRGRQTPVDLVPFYNSGVSIVHVCFVHGSEDILFVDSNAQARIFSLISLQPRYVPSWPHTRISDISCPFIDLLLYNFHKYRALSTLPQMAHVCSLFENRMEYLL